MKVTYKESLLLESDEIEIIYNPENGMVINGMIEYLKRALNTLPCYDDKMKCFIEVPLLSIYYIEITDHRIYACTESQEFRVCYQKLVDVKQEDVFSYFRKVNVTTLVNMNHVIGVRILEGAKRQLFLDNGEELIVTRSFKDNVEDYVEKFK